MGLFDKKYCDICGEKIGLLGNRKLADGNMCKNCASLISPWMTDRKEHTVAEMADHLAYRSVNKDALRNFQVSDVLGYNYYKLYINRTEGTWFITSHQNYVDANPDILSFNQVTGCEIDIHESKRELYAKTSDNRMVSYNPPEYDYDYDFYVTVYVTGFFNNVMKFKLNTGTIEDMYSPQYKELESLVYNIKNVFDQMAQGADGSNLVVPEQLVIDSFTRQQMQRESNMYKDMQRRRMEAFEYALRTPGAPAPGPGYNMPNPGPAVSGPANRPPQPGPAGRPPQPGPHPGPRPHGNGFRLDNR